ncbi:purine/pyrimidine permease [Priestia taiwanensis]|nr:purine/pyrimidine permease [Priestia taiwanensis]MBM7362533.1 xanthine/uracil permease [Priestia taiwanensis]
MKHISASLQWVLFIISGNLVAPIAIASAYGLEGTDAMLFIQRTLFVLSVAGLLQVLFGHKLPIHEGPAGLWWGVFTLYASLGVTLFGSTTETLQVLQFSLLLSGVLSILLSIFGIVEKLAAYFTSTVMGIYLLLLVVQLSGAFFNGMLGLTYTQDGTIHSTIALISLAVMGLAFYLNTVPRLKQYSMMICICFGWVLFALFDLTTPIAHTTDLFTIPTLFAFGPPIIEWSMVPTVFLVTLLLMTNMLASVRIMESVLKSKNEKVDNISIKKAGFFTGVGQLIGGLFSAVGPVPISGAAGFVAANNIPSRIPFIIASVIIIGCSLLSPVTAFFATLPSSVGFAAIFPIFAGMLGLAIQELDRVHDRNTLYKTVGIPLFAGIGIMFVPSTAFGSLSPVLSSLLSNGLVFGTVIAIIFEVVRSRGTS